MMRHVSPLFATEIATVCAVTYYGYGWFVMVFSVQFFSIFCLCVVKFQRDYLDVKFLPRDIFFTTFLESCGKGESFRTTTCLKTVVGGKQGYASCKLLSLQQSLFLC